VTEAKDRQLLDRFGPVSEQEVAGILGITVESLRNRPLNRKPAYFQSGRRRLFIEASVREFLGLPPAPKVKYATPSADPDLKKAIDEAALVAAQLTEMLLNIQALLKRERADRDQGVIDGGAIGRLVELGLPPAARLRLASAWGGAD